MNVNKYKLPLLITAVFAAMPMVAHANDVLNLDKWFYSFADPYGTLADVPKPTPEELTCPQTIDPAQPLTVEKSVHIALCRQPRLEASWLGIKVQAASLGEAKASAYPSLSASAGRYKNHTRYPSGRLDNTRSNSTSTSIQLNWRAYDFGARMEATRSAESSVQAAIANHDAETLKTINTVVSAYYSAQGAHASMRTRERHLVLAEQTLDAVQRKMVRGASSQADVLQLQITTGKAKLELSRRKANYERELLTLAQSMAIESEAKLTLAEAPVDKAVYQPLYLPILLEQALHKHPQLIAMRKQLMAAQQRLDSVRAEGRPTLDFNVSVYQNGRPMQGAIGERSRETVAGVAVNFPIFDGFGRTYKVQSADVMVAQKQAELQDAENTILAELAKAHAEAASNYEMLNISLQMQDQSEALLASVLRRFERGAADVTEIQAALSAVADAHQQSIQATLEWRLAKQRLLFNSGAELEEFKMRW
jgi:outer membrane protein